MDLLKYRLRREELLKEKPQFRNLCLECRQPDFSCYCSLVQKFDPKIVFAILIHPIEVRRRIATGRMSHACLKNSHLIRGHDYSQDTMVNSLITDTQNQCMVLYPGVSSTNLTSSTEETKSNLFQKDKTPVIFVIDGTWNTARTMLNKSKNLHSLPRICFSSESPSNFRVRKQPRPGCFSTIEAIHHTLDLIGPTCGFDTALREHDNLLHVFNKMIDRQIEIKQQSKKHYRQVG